VKTPINILGFEEKFYKALNPNITTSKPAANGGCIEYFNSSNDEEDNAMPQKLLDLKQKSSIHAHFLNLKSSLIYAGGLYPTDDNNSALAQFLTTKNGAGDDVQKVFKKASSDMAIFEECFIEVIYSADGKIAEVYHKPFNTIRVGESNEYGVPDQYYYSTTWGEITNQRKKKKMNDLANAVIIPAFNPNEIGEGRQILRIKKYDSAGGAYIIPSYMAADFWINVVYMIGQYVTNKFHNGYHLQGFLYINSNIPVEEQQKMVREWENAHMGVDRNKKSIVIVFGDTAIAKPEFVPIQDSLSNSIFKDFMGEATKQICFAHGASLNLLGLSNSDSFGSSNPDSNDINVSRMEYIANVVSSYQEDLLDGFNKLFEANGLGSATLLNQTLKLTIPELQPEDTTVDERREIVLGLNPLATSGSTTNNINTPTVAA